MTTAKKTLDFGTHPWESELAACRAIPLGLCVLDATAALSELAKAQNQQGKFFDVADQTQRICKNLKIIDGTQTLARLFKHKALPSQVTSIHGAPLLSLEAINQLFTNLMLESPPPQLQTLTNALRVSEMSPTSFYLTSENPKFGIAIELLARKIHNGQMHVLAKFEYATQTIGQLEHFAQLRNLFDAMSEFVIIVDLNGHISFSNRSAKLMLGHPETNHPRSLKDFFHPTSEKAVLRACHEVMSGLKTWCGILDLQGTTPVAMQCHLSAVQQNMQGQCIGFSIMGRPAAAEEKLRFEVEIRDQLIENSGQMVILGQIFSQVIHEINNPLTVILGKAERIIDLAQKPQFDAGEFTIAAEKIIKMSRRTEKTLQTMKTFSHFSRGNQIADVPVQKLLDDVRSLIEGGAKKAGVEIKLPEIPQILHVHADGLKLSQVLMNLFDNSFDAVKDQPNSWVELRMTSDDTWIRLQVVDSGQGIDNDIKHKLFDAFFTTKNVRRGTGIGLTLSRQIARRFGGDLYLDDSAANTTFVLVLPRLAADSAGRVANQEDP